MVELNTIINNFDKYGDPKITMNSVVAEAFPAPKEPLKWNKEATVRWYWENTPATTVLTVLLAFVGVFSAGYGIGQWRAELPKATATEARSSSTPQDRAAAQPASEASK